MTITAKYLRDWQNSFRVYISPEQKRVILEYFSEEPWPYEWSDWDIFIQVRNYLNCGEFMRHAAGDGEPPPIISDEDEPF